MIAVGIDVSKSKSTVAILNSDGTPLSRPFDMAHTLPEMNSFVERLRAFDTPVTILMEYTGHYHYPVLTSSWASEVIWGCCESLKAQGV